MAIQSICTGCGKQLSVADEHAGKRARCPACGTIYTVPSAVTAQFPGALQTGQGTGQGSIESPYPLASGQPSSQPELSQATPADELFWMRAVDGNIYGPTDRENLNRWFREGRVGVGYQIRQGESGLWEDASIFRPEHSSTTTLGTQNRSNPYAAQTAASNASNPGAPLYKYPKQDRGVVVLVMGILSFAICFIFGIVAVVMGRAALNDIQAGLANPNDKPLVQIGFWLGVANLILHALGFGFLLLMIALSAANQI